MSFKGTTLSTLKTIERSRSQSLRSSGRYGHSHSVYHWTCSSSVQESRNLQDKDWLSVQSAVLGLFHRKKLAESQLWLLGQSIRNLMGSHVGPFLLEYYMKQVLTRGMIILRERIRCHTGIELLESLDETWNYFFSEIVPMLQAIFIPVKTKQINIRQAALLSFRDVVLLKLPIQEALENFDQPFPSGIQQMLLILQSAEDNFPPSNGYLEAEKLVALVVVPYLGFQGLYQGRSEPVVWSKEAVLGKKQQKFKGLRLLHRRSNPQPFRVTEDLYSVEGMFHSAYSRQADEY